MQIILRQSFPFGRFHATPWKVFPFDDPHGEWPPSPWRLLRAIISRAYQYEREEPTVTEVDRAALVRAFCSSKVSWSLPGFSWRGPGLRQYHPAEFKRVPAGAKSPGMMAYNTTKVQDNFWLTERAGVSEVESSAVWWFLDGGEWTEGVIALLDCCLARMTYFGRAESITEIKRVSLAGAAIPSVNCCLEVHRTQGAVPVLMPRPDATLEQAQASTDDSAVADATIPPGAQWMYAKRPVRPLARSKSYPRRGHEPTQLLQFGIGSRVSPQLNATVMLTQRFRGRVLLAFFRLGSNGHSTSWKDAELELRECASLLSGKDGEGRPVEGHQHALFFLHWENGKPTRLCVWRQQPFTDLEQEAILRASELPLELGYKADPWTVNLVPLDNLVSPPPALDPIPKRHWRTMTPFVPPRHVYGRQGRAKDGESVEEQVRRELVNHGFKSDGVEVAASRAGWVSTHQPVRERNQVTNAAKIGYEVALKFPSPVHGPLALGCSAHFGLGLFVPVTR